MERQLWDLGFGIWDLGFGMSNMTAENRWSRFSPEDGLSRGTMCGKSQLAVGRSSRQVPSSSLGPHEMSCLRGMAVVWSTHCLEFRCTCTYTCTCASGRAGRTGRRATRDGWTLAACVARIRQRALPLPASSTAARAAGAVSQRSVLLHAIPNRSLDPCVAELGCLGSGCDRTQQPSSTIDFQLVHLQPSHPPGVSIGAL